MDFSTLLPGIHDWVSSLPKTPPFLYLQDIYAPFGALHLLGLALLGGCVILINLRLLGAGLTSEPPSVVVRNLFLWQVIGACIVIGTGLIIGALNSEKLYYSPAFFVKMVSMVAALIFTFGVSNIVARQEGKVSLVTMITAAVALLILLFGVGVFSITEGVSPGVFHVLSAGFAVLFIFGKRTRIIAGIAFLVMFGGIVEGYMAVGMDSDSQELLNLSVIRCWIGGLLLIALIGYEIYREEATAGGRIARMIAVLSILSWVAVAAGGRWIGFS